MKIDRTSAIGLLASTGILFFNLVEASKPPECVVNYNKDYVDVSCPAKSGALSQLGLAALIAQGYLSYKGLTGKDDSNNSVQKLTSGTGLFDIEEKVLPSAIDKDTLRIETMADLQKVLAMPENKWLKCVIKANNLILVGVAGSGKTTFAKIICLLRQITRGDEIVVHDPHADKNGWPSHWKQMGARKKYEEIGKGIDAFQKRILMKTGEASFCTSVWNEMTNYSAFIPDKTENFFKEALSDCRKSIERPIMLTHSLNKDSLGGGKKSGAWASLISGCPTVILEADFDEDGDPCPAFKATLLNLGGPKNGKDQTEMKVNYEPWLKDPDLVSTLNQLLAEKNTQHLDLAKK
jgi:energy-coupling factor transporter ATP-binding protein EcfA2